MEIRLLQKNDIKIGLLETLAELAEVDPITSEKWDQIYSAISANKNHRIFVAIVEGRIVGSLTCIIEQKIIHGGGTVAHLEDISVLKSFQNSGIAGKLIEHGISEARTAGCYKVVLDCSIALESYYVHKGFHTAGRYMRLNL